MRVISVDEFMGELREVLKIVRQAIEARGSGITGTGTAEELEFILKDLERLEDLVRWQKIPPKEDRRLEAARVVADSFPTDRPIGQRICRLADWYKRGLA
jgi:hypothetical protein